jgi:hypothetical protein
MLEGHPSEEIAFATSVESDARFVPDPGFVVAIPVKDQEKHLLACLTALSQQYDRSGRSISRTRIRIVVFANNCRICSNNKPHWLCYRARQSDRCSRSCPEHSTTL